MSIFWMEEESIVCFWNSLPNEVSVRRSSEMTVNYIQMKNRVPMKWNNIYEKPVSRFFFRTAVTIIKKKWA